MKVIVVEDSRLAREGLVRMLCACDSIEVVGAADHPTSALELVQATRPDVIFLDIHMPGATGFDLLEQLDYAPRIVFTTAYSEHAIRAFDYNTVDYLLKPVSPERLAKAVGKLREHLQVAGNAEPDLDRDTDAESEPAEARQVLDIDSKIFIKDGEKCFLVSLSSIRYIESCRNYVLVYFDGKRAYVKKTMSSVEARLPKGYFFRASRQHIVNLQAVAAVEESISLGYKLTLCDGTVLEISRRNAAELKDLLSL
jgi:two-component system, LytTR family, response regulator